MDPPLRCSRARLPHGLHTSPRTRHCNRAVRWHGPTALPSLTAVWTALVLWARSCGVRGGRGGSQTQPPPSFEWRGLCGGALRRQTDAAHVPWGQPEHALVLNRLLRLRRGVDPLPSGSRALDAGSSPDPQRTSMPSTSPRGRADITAHLCTTAPAPSTRYNTLHCNPPTKAHHAAAAPAGQRHPSMAGRGRSRTARAPRQEFEHVLQEMIHP